jgi:hypothetical protein
MSCVNLRLKGVHQHINYDQLSNTLESNFKMYYDWAFLTIGGWSDVSVPTSGIYGADFSRLRPVYDPNYNDGQVWEAARKDFVWESGIDYVNTTGGTGNPSPVGLPVVNGTPVSTGYYIDYPNGQVIFTNPVTGTVKLPHSYRLVQVYKLDDAPWWREIQNSSYRPDSDQFLQSASGDWSIFGTNRIQLPAVVVGVSTRGTANGYEIGSSSLEEVRDVVFGIISENPWDRKNLMDIINSQVGRKLPLFNANTAVNEWPLDYRGMLTGTKDYPYLVSESGYYWSTCDLQKSSITDVQMLHPQLYMAVVRTTTETIL